MDNKLTIKSAEEWIQLPELNFPKTEYANQKGVIYKTTKVGGLWIQKYDRNDIDFSNAYSVSEKYLLPTIVVLKNEQETLMKLPVYAGAWVVNCMGLVGMGKKLFPAKIEFSIFDGKPSIEFQLN